MFYVFSSAVKKFCEWFRGCQCHDHIWMSDQSDLQKERQFMRENPGTTRCPWKGKRCSECARGAVRTNIEKVRQCTSVELTKRASRLPANVRERCMACFASMKESWCEEVSCTQDVWQELPWLAMGIYPFDDVSAGITQKCLALFSGIAAQRPAPRKLPPLQPR